MSALVLNFVRQDKNKGGTLFPLLRLRNQRNRKYSSPATRAQLRNRQSLHNRPIEIKQRSRFDDLKIDTVLGKDHQPLLISSVDRKTGYVWLKM